MSFIDELLHENNNTIEYAVTGIRLFFTCLHKAFILYCLWRHGHDAKLFRFMSHLPKCYPFLKIRERYKFSTKRPSRYIWCCFRFSCAVIIGYWLDMEIYVRVLVRSNIARRQESNINYTPERVYIFSYYIRK